jgi:hypothetical protein
MMGFVNLISFGSIQYLSSLLFALPPALGQFAPEEIIVNSCRPTFYNPETSVPGKIAVEEHVKTGLFTGVFTTPTVNLTNEITYDAQVYLQDVASRYGLCQYQYPDSNVRLARYSRNIQ